MAKAFCSSRTESIPRKECTTMQNKKYQMLSSMLSRLETGGKVNALRDQVDTVTYDVQVGKWQ